MFALRRLSAPFCTRSLFPACGVSLALCVDVAFFFLLTLLSPFTLLTMKRGSSTTGADRGRAFVTTPPTHFACLSSGEVPGYFTRVFPKGVVILILV